MDEAVTAGVVNTAMGFAQPLVKYPYGAQFGPSSTNNPTGAVKMPFEFYVTAKIKL